MTPADLAGMLEMMAQALRMLPAGGLPVPAEQQAAPVVAPPALAPAPPVRTLADWLDVHDGVLLTRGYKAQTIKNRRSNLAHVRRLWGTVPVADLKPHAVASALRTFPKEKSSTAVRVLSELRDAYVEAIANGWAETNPARDIKPPKHKVMRERLELEVWMQMRTLAQASPQRWVESMLLLGLAILALAVLAWRERESVLPTPTDKLCARLRDHYATGACFGETTSSETVNLWVAAHRPDLDGVWYGDRIDPSRGILLPHALPRWAAAVRHEVAALPPSAAWA